APLLALSAQSQRPSRHGSAWPNPNHGRCRKARNCGAGTGGRRMNHRFHLRAGIRVCALLAAGMLPASVPSQAETYPSRPITIVVPFGPGSATDPITRVIAQHLTAALNQTIVVETRPGANGAIAAAYVARAAPDGYTLFMSTNSPHSAAPTLNKNIAYDPIKDFVPI